MPLEIHIQGFDITNLDARMQAMARPCYSALTNHAGEKPTIVFVPSKRHARQTAVDLWAYASAEGKGDKFLQVRPCFDPAIHCALQGLPLQYHGLLLCLRCLLASGKQVICYPCLKLCVRGQGANSLLEIAIFSASHVHAAVQPTKHTQHPCIM